MKKRKRKKDDFRQLACEARSRLKGGYWSAWKSERATDLQKMQSEGKDTDKVTQYYRSKFDADFRRSEDELFYQRVVEILECNDLVTNPIARLMDEEIYQSLENAARQRYVLEIADKYRKMCERYNKEQALKSFLVH